VISLTSKEHCCTCCGYGQGGWWACRRLREGRFATHQGMLKWSC
jgi:hypothetical protein